MVAPKKRGGKAGPASKKAAAAEAEQIEDKPEETQANESEAVENNAESTDNGDSEAKTEEATPATETSEEKPAEPVVEKVDPGKLLVENLPSSLLFTYKEHLTELFTKYGEVTNVKRGSISVTELTTTPTLSAIVEFKNKDSLEKALSENGTVIDKCKITVSVEPTTYDTSAVVCVPLEVSAEYIELLFSECGEITRVKDLNKGKYKSLLVTFASTDSLTKALKLDRELRINAFVVTVSKYRGDEPTKPATEKTQTNTPNKTNANKQTPQRSGGFRGGRGSGGNNFANNQNFRGGRGGRGGGGGGGGYGAGAAMYGGYNPNVAWGGGYMGGYMNDGQRPNKRMRQM